METQEIMKKCNKCGEVLPIDKFYKCAKTKDGYQSHCKQCHDGYVKAKKMIKDAPKVEQSAAKECDDMGLDKIPSRLFIHELRRRGYRGELELVTIQKVVI